MSFTIHYSGSWCEKSARQWWPYSHICCVSSAAKTFNFSEMVPSCTKICHLYREVKGKIAKGSRATVYDKTIVSHPWKRGESGVAYRRQQLRSVGLFLLPPQDSVKEVGLLWSDWESEIPWNRRRCLTDIWGYFSETGSSGLQNYCPLLFSPIQKIQNSSMC